MSYQRSPHPLSRFHSISEYYVYSDGEHVHDHGANYTHNPSFCELIGDIVQSETRDSLFAAKITRILAQKLGCANQLRGQGHTASYRTLDHEEKIYSKILKEVPKLFDLTIIISDFIDQYEGDPRLVEDLAIDELVNLHLYGDRWNLDQKT